MANSIQAAVFQSEAKYEGVGSARFISPSGTITGPAVAIFDERGKNTIRLRVEKLATDEPAIVGLTEFLSGRPIVRDGVVVGYSLHFDGNSCAELVITTPEGTLSASGDIHYNQTSGAFTVKGELQFIPLRSQFQVADVGPPKYWVLPLSNFVSEHWERSTGLDDHPLRIRTSEMSETAARTPDMADHPTLHGQGLIAFAFNGRPCFIEPLQDYVARVDRLAIGGEQSLVTALMIGEIAGEVGDFAEVQKWFPTDALSVLGLATGIEIGAPWLDICDSSGLVVRRFHASFGRPRFSRGHAAIRQGIHTGIGHLLTRSLASMDRRSAALRTAIDNVIRAGLYDSGTVEERLVYLFRALDGLCNEFDLYETMNPSTALTRQRAGNLRAALETAATAVSGLASDAAKLHQHGEAEFLRRVAKQVASAQIVRSGFTNALLRLLDKFQLHDARVMRAYYGNRRWTDILGRYRAIAVHRDYLDFLGGEADIRDVARVVFHLHDILTRIALMRLNYEGTYQPTVAKWPIDAQLDWVQPETPAARLGYPHAQPDAEDPTEGV